MLLLYFQTFIWLLNSWMHNIFYSHGFLVPVVSSIIVWSRRSELKNILQEKEPRGIYVFAFGLILYVAGTLWKAPFLLGLSLIPVLVGLILLFYGKKFMRKLLFPISFLIFMIPLPGLYIIGISLQYFTADAAVWISQILGVEVYKNNLELHIQNCPILIGAACSGLRSIIALLALSAIFTYIVKCSIKRKFIILFMAVPIAIAANTIRVASTVLIADSMGCDVATNFFHDYSSIFLFIIALTILIIFAKILKCDLS